MKSNWRFSFDFKPSQTLTGSLYKSFLHITDNGPGVQQRVLGLWMIPNTQDIGMHFEFDSTDPNVTPWFATHSDAITLNEWNTVEISQMVHDGNSILLFKVNGLIYHNVTNVNPRTYPALDFYNARGEWQPADGHMRYFQFYSADLATDIPLTLRTYK